MNVTYTNRSAKLSDCGKYRYELIREWSTSGFAPEGAKKEQVVFCLLNPSTADSVEDDPTIRRCVSFAQGWGYSCLVVVNLFAFRATDPSELLKCPDPVGKRNDEYILKNAKEAALFVAGWGTKGVMLNRDNFVLDMLRSSRVAVHMLGQNRDGTPKHPLYLRGETVPGPYR